MRKEALTAEEQMKPGSVETSSDLQRATLSSSHWKWPEETGAGTLGHIRLYTAAHLAPSRTDQRSVCRSGQEKAWALGCHALWPGVQVYWPTTWGEGRWGRGSSGLCLGSFSVAVPGDFQPGGPREPLVHLEHSGKAV